VSTEQNKAMSARLYLEIFGSGHFDVADEILSGDCVSHAADAPPRTGTEGIKLQAALLRRAIPDLQTTLEDQLAEGDRVASRWRGSGTNTGELRMGDLVVPPTGRKVSFGEMRIDRFEGGRIVESWFIPDRLSLWQQLGMLPSPGEASRPKPSKS
jgi:predicted ester cyclase